MQFIENKGQFPDHVDYKLALKAGDIYFEGNKITYQLYEKGKISSYRHGLSNDSSNINCHVQSPGGRAVKPVIIKRYHTGLPNSLTPRWASRETQQT